MNVVYTARTEGSSLCCPERSTVPTEEVVVYTVIATMTIPQRKLSLRYCTTERVIFDSGTAFLRGNGV